MKPRDHASPARRAGGWKLRDDALAWIADAKPEWRRGDGHPDLVAIAAATGPSYPNLWRISTDNTPANPSATAVDLAKGAAKAYGIPFLVAYCRICQDPSISSGADRWFTDANTPGDLVAAFIQHVGSFTSTPVLEAAGAA